ncbi:DEAD/DEAH box helicase [Methanothermobacter sp. K4]|uniref:DEAD/DEAH box helicase n=1 Tax=Methanothermobacter sp. K4 TaxID=2913262 RepID=UPI001EDC5555|nr:DEAD/DEAH box helicase [Methanothermobacter sp. K4]MCG2828638.1 DEAD/DEAH box helicase [Methanothermobacter sp. K4]
MIVLNRRKRSVDFIPAGSPRGALNTRRKPGYWGKLKIKKTSSGPRIARFTVEKDERETLRKPSEAIKLLRKQAVFLTGRDRELEELLENHGIRYRYARVCQHCLHEGYVTLVSSRASTKHEGQIICSRCVDEVIRRELKLAGMDKSAFRNFRRLIRRGISLERVLEMMSPRFDPLANHELTLYDMVTATAERTPKVPIDKLNLPERFVQILRREGNRVLRPVQVLAVDAGLLGGASLMVVSATASGKTLIGELAGIPRAMKGERFIYLTPLVALANQKYRDFKKRYSTLGLKTAIKVGMSRIKAKGELRIPDTDVADADIIVGTYEGIDYILRSGRAGILGDVGVVVVDEIHTLEDEERGARLNGMIWRIKRLFPDAQIIALSATVKNSAEIASDFGLKLVEYDKRPVPLERHLIFSRSGEEKKNIILRLAGREFSSKSRQGFQGQTIIFTNSRRKTRLIAEYLTRNRVSAAAYHAGLSYAERQRIEKAFASQKLAAVVTTAALAAGVDFPASQVIFETLLMGNRWLTSNEFSQMLGRAGRPSYHDRGVVYVLAEIGMEFDGDSEESVALELLESGPDSVEVHYTDEKILEQVLADITSGAFNGDNENEEWFMDAGKALDILEAYEMISRDKMVPTQYGVAVSRSFIGPEEAEYIRSSLSGSVIDTVIELEPFQSAYLSSRLHRRLSQVLATNFSTRLLADSTLDIISTGDNLVKLDTRLQEAVLNIQMDFLSCECSERPFCGCIQRKLSAYIINERLRGRDPADISKHLLSRYHVQTYPGDIFSWLDSVVRMLEAVKRIAGAFKRSGTVRESTRLIRGIERGRL